MLEKDLAHPSVEISVVIPAYNESLRIGNTLKLVHEYFKGRSFEILVVNDGSSDNTVQKVESHQIPELRVISYEKNQGKGYAVQQGVLNSKGKYILLTDADLSTPIEYFANLYEHIDQADLVIGSRGMKESQVSNQILRVWLGKTGNKLIQLVLPGIKDTQCGFKLFKGDSGREIFSKQQIKGFGFDFEILFIAQRLGLEIKEVPVKWTNALGSKVKPRHYISTLLELGRLVLNNWQGKYR
ncbi:MAG: glycosyltransferase family 2 protein [Bacteroidia bacterium]|nr:glycosyltransferase family 2 protein [Bacteroidia bacterium]